MPSRRSATGSLSVKIQNGPSTVVVGDGLTTEQAVARVCEYLPVVPAEEHAQVVAERDVLKRGVDEAIAEHSYSGRPVTVFTPGNMLRILRRARDEVNRD